MYKPRRSELAKFLPTQELIRAFEQLFDQSASSDAATIAAIITNLTTLSNTVSSIQLDLEDVAIDAGTTDAKANLVSAELAKIADALQLLALAPPKVVGDDVVSDTLRWKVKAIGANHSALPGDWLDCDASGGAITITPPDVARYAGRMVAVCKSDATANQVIWNGQTNGAPTAFTAVQYTTMLLVSNGTEWRLM